MGILNKIFGSYGPSQSISDPDLRIFRTGGKTHSGVWVNEHEAMRFSAVFACIQILSRIIAQLPIAVHRRTATGSDIAREHPVDWLISQEPNDLQTSYIWRETTQAHTVGWGNGYCEIVRRGNGKPVELIQLLPDRTFPQIDQESGELVYYTTIEGEQRKVSWRNMLHIPGLGFDGMLGYSVIHHARQSIGLGLAAEEFGAKFFGQGAKSGGFLQYPGKLTQNRAKNINKSFEQDIAGLENAHKTHVLEEGMKWVATTIPPDDAQFLETRQFQVEDVARWFGVPLFMIQAHNKDTSWGTGVEQQMIGFLVVHMDSWFRRWEQELDRKLFVPSERREFFVKFNVEGLLRADSKSKAEFLRTLVQGAMMTPDEARSKLDLPPASKNGDRLLMEKNMTFLDDPETDQPTEGMIQ